MNCLELAPPADDDSFDPTVETTDETQSRVTPMLLPIAHLQGMRTGSYSPLDYFALTVDERQDIDPMDDALWLSVDELKTVAKDGIHFGGQRYWHEALAPYVSGPSGAPRAALELRYDRALLARGVLDEVRVILVEDDGRRREICRARLRDEVLANIDYARVTRAMRSHLNALRAKRAVAEGEFVRLRSGADAVEDLFLAQALRERRQQGARPAAKVAAPIGVETGDAVRNDYRDQLKTSERKRTSEVEAATPISATAGDAERGAVDIAEGARSTPRGTRRKRPGRAEPPGGVGQPDSPPMVLSPQEPKTEVASHAVPASEARRKALGARTGLRSERTTASPLGDAHQDPTSGEESC